MASIDVDELVNGWLLEKFVEGSYDPETDGPTDDLRVVSADADWDCGCWSSYTREDTFEMTAQIQTAAGVVDFKYGQWGDFPQFIEDLEIYRVNSVCSYEQED